MSGKVIDDGSLVELKEFMHAKPRSCTSMASCRVAAFHLRLMTTLAIAINCNITFPSSTFN